MCLCVKKIRYCIKTHSQNTLNFSKKIKTRYIKKPMCLCVKKYVTVLKRIVRIQLIFLKN